MPKYRDRLFSFLLAFMSVGTLSIAPELLNAENRRAGAESLPAISSTEAIRQAQELAALEQIPPDQRTPEQKARLLQLRLANQELVRQFSEFINSPEIEAAIAELDPASRQANLALENLTGLQDNLRQLNQNAALLYPLILDDRIELVLLTPDAPPIRYTSQVSRQDLNRTILKFRQALQDPISDPLPPAQQLYDWLIRPLEQDLAAANTQAILYSPESSLRYVPLAALHDGDRWLVERWAVNNITAASLTDFDRPATLPPKILAAAFTEGNYTVPVGGSQFNFSGFPYARLEVEQIAEKFPDTTVLLDRDFTPEAVRSLSRDHNIIHLATTAVAIPEDPLDSFILFGNGESVRLRDFRNWNLSNVDLVVLSSCETAVGGTLGDGTEILGLGYQFQRSGAKAIAASLWAVNDQGTQVLMDYFYTAIKDGSTPAIALRQAQVALIQASWESASNSGSSAIDRDASPQESDRNNGIRVRSIPTAPSFSHPYYWAPFILIGNGL